MMKKIKWIPFIILMLATYTSLLTGIVSAASVDSGDSTLDQIGKSLAFSSENGDFLQMSALENRKMGWGPGRSFDNRGRPHASTQYQNKYGEYSAFFIAPDTKNIYLTFDNGYENGFTPSILETLKEKGVIGVFFITYDYARRQPELVKRMIDEGHILANHSTKHESYPDFTLQEAYDDIMNLHNYVLENYDYEMRLFRFPMGEFSEQMLALVQSCGYTSVFWSFAYNDWDTANQQGGDAAFEIVSKAAHPGAIYLLHTVSSDNAQILGSVIDDIRAKGYTVAKFNLHERVAFHWVREIKLPELNSFHLQSCLPRFAWRG